MARKRAEHRLSQALAEKDVLLAEVHHRVKNNLSAFIALLSLEGSYEDTPAGDRLRKDLQNRARSMALIHDTLYRTGDFSRVDMDMYLSTLVSQIVPLYTTPCPVATEVLARGTTIDLDRATPCGLIVNELVVNALKYAFPAPAGGMQKDCPCTIRVAMSLADGEYILEVSDNGVGLPAAIDVGTAKTLGLKLVNFLARHQLRATVSTETDHGTRFTVRFRQQVK
jgi:two-component sensor histidine kinase